MKELAAFSYQVMLVMGAVLIHVDGYHPNYYPFVGSPIITAYTVPVFGDASAVESVFTIASRLRGHQGFVPNPAATIFVPPAYPLIAGSPLPNPSYAVPLAYQSPSYAYNTPPITPSVEYKPPLTNSEGDVDSSGSAGGDTTTQLMTGGVDESSSGSSVPEESLSGDSNIEVENSEEVGLGEEGSEIPETSVGGESLEVGTGESEKIKPDIEEGTDGSSATNETVEESSCDDMEGSSEKCQNSANVIVSGDDNGPQATTTLDNHGGYTLNISYGVVNGRYPDAIPSTYEVPPAGYPPGLVAQKRTGVEGAPSSGSVTVKSADVAGRVAFSGESLEPAFIRAQDPTFADASSFPPQFSVGYALPRPYLDSYGLPVADNYWVLGPEPVKLPLGNIPTRYPQAPGNNVYYRLQRSLHRNR